MLQINGLTLRIGDRTLCRGLDFTLGPGELCAVLGCNGSGKTTLMHALAGGSRAATGRITINGRPLADYRQRELGRAAGLLLQREEHDYSGTVADYVLLGRYPHAHSMFGWGALDEQAASGALAAFDLEALAHRSYASLSGGERQRARLAQLSAQRPQVLLLDEPLQHLDLRYQLRTLSWVRQAVNVERRAALVVLHDLTFAARCDRVLMLYGDGRCAAGSSSELLAPERLEELYGCRVAAFGSGDYAHFIPVI